MISQIPGGKEGLDQLVCDGKTQRGSAIETDDSNHRFIGHITLYARGLGVALVQKCYDTHESSERAALKELLSSLDLNGVLIQADALHTPPVVFRRSLAQRADVLLTVKSQQNPLHRQIGCQFEGKRKIPVTPMDHEKRYGRDTVLELRGREAPEHNIVNWPGSAWTAEVITDTLTRQAKRKISRHLSLTSSAPRHKPCCA